MNKQFASSAL